MRLIDADALMDDICGALNQMTNIGIVVDGEWLWGKLNDALDHAPTVEPQRWIPCSDRMPEESEDIIVTYVDNEETRIIPVNYGDGTWYDCIFNTALDPIKVIAWMPLPESYKEVQDEIN